MGEEAQVEMGGLVEVEMEVPMGVQMEAVGMVAQVEMGVQMEAVAMEVLVEMEAVEMEVQVEVLMEGLAPTTSPMGGTSGSTLVLYR
jgi:hypothetical protein